MPFTPSHAVVALPLLRTRLVPAAVAVGAMAPDLPLFVRVGTPGYSVTHQVAWLPVTVLIGLGLLLVWRLLLRPVARELLPDAVARRLPPYWGEPARAVLRETFVDRGPAWATSLLLLASLTIGVLSHLLWDSFTHEGRVGADLVPALGETWGGAAGTVWLQNASSAFGLCVLVIAGAVWFRRAPVGDPPRRVLPRRVRAAVWLALPILLVVATAIGVVISWRPPFDAAWAERVAYRSMPPAVALWGAILLLTAALVRRASRAAAAPDPANP